jgi:hypothetical protein
VYQLTGFFKQTTNKTKADGSKESKGDQFNLQVCKSNTKTKSGTQDEKKIKKSCTANYFILSLYQQKKT